MRAYPHTNLTTKTAVVVYRDEPNGFIITAWLTSRAGQRRPSVEPVTIDNRPILLLLQLPTRQVWVGYNAEGDVLYLSFARPQQATDSVMGEDGHIYHYRGEQLVGVTILHARQHSAAPEE